MTDTFTQPSSPTTGLQGYDLEGQKKQWRGLSFAIATRRKALRRKPNHSTTLPPHLNKDSHPMRELIADMTGTLSKSVSDLIASNPANLNDALEKNFVEFHQALQEAVDEGLIKRAPDDVFKGMGTVGRMARLAQHIHREAENIRGGRDDEDSEADDDCTEEVSGMLDHMELAADIGMHHAVNEHVGELEDGDTEDNMPQGVSMIHVPTHDGQDVMVAKTDLPSDLIKFIVDPSTIEEAALTLGTSMLMKAGISDPALQKLFSDDALAKGAPPFPPKKKPAAPAAAPPDDGSADGDDRSGYGDSSGTDDGDDDGSDGDDDGSDMDDPLDVLGRLLAACMIQLSHIQEITGGGDPNAADPSADPNAAPAAPAPSQLQRSQPTGNLRKSATDADIQAMVNAGVEAQLAGLRPALEAMLAQPAPAKGYVGSTTALTKSEDTGALAKSAADEADELAKMAPEDRAIHLAKMAYRNPISESPINR